MHCPFCNNKTTQVFNSRKTRSGSNVWRRRRCTSCQQVFTSYEAPLLDFLSVQAPDGTTTSYSKARLYSSIYLAFVGSQLGNAVDIDNVTQTIEQKLLRQATSTIQRDNVITIVSSTLRPLSISALMRYLADHPPTDSKATARLLK